MPEPFNIFQHGGAIACVPPPPYRRVPMAESPPEPPFLRLGPETPASPLVLSVPHAGRAYSAALLAAARLPRSR